MARALRAAALLLLARPAYGWRTRGELRPTRGSALHYVGKFCYDYAHGPDAAVAGALDVKVVGHVDGHGKKLPHEREPFKPMPFFPPAPDGLFLAVFSDDRPHEWEYVRRQWKNLTCQDFLWRAAAVRPVTPTLPRGEFKANVVIMDPTRPRFLYFSFVFCDVNLEDDKNMPVSYMIHARNMRAGFQAEFSMDEMGLLRIEIVGAVLFTALLLGIYLYSVINFGIGALRSRLPLQFLMLSCFLSIVGCVALTAHLLAYASDGEGLGAVEVLGELAECLARVMLSLLQLFLARGKALLSPEGNWLRRSFLLSLVGGIFFISIGCELYGRYFGDLDWSTTLYFYASWPGFTILTLNTVLFAEVCVATVQLFKRQESDTQVVRFYQATFACAVAYFVALPVTCLLAHLLPPWDRKRVVTQVEVTVRFVATAVLGVWFRPSRLDPKISARMEAPEQRQNAVELADTLSGAGTGSGAAAARESG